MSGLPTFPLTDGRVLRRVVCVWKVTRECVLDRSSCVLVRLGRKRTREHRSVRRLPLLIIIDFGAKDWTLLRNHWPPRITTMGDRRNLRRIVRTAKRCHWLDHMHRSSGHGTTPHVRRGFTIADERVFMYLWWIFFWSRDHFFTWSLVVFFLPQLHARRLTPNSSLAKLQLFEPLKLVHWGEHLQIRDALVFDIDFKGCSHTHLFHLSAALLLSSRRKWEFYLPESRISIFPF